MMVNFFIVLGAITFAVKFMDLIEWIDGGKY